MKAIYLNDVARGDKKSSVYVRFGKAAVYRLEPAMGEIEHVFLSTSTVMGTPETYAFASDEKGQVSDWCELPCSMKGDVTHEEVLLNMGYEVEQ